MQNNEHNHQRKKERNKMIKFRHRKVDNNHYKIYMVHLKESPNQKYINIVPIPVNKGFCYTQSKETAKKICRILESITSRQDLKYWNRQTLKRVQQIVRLMNRISYHRHVYPIPFENLEAILGWNLAAQAVTETYKKEIATYKFAIANEAKPYSTKTYRQKWLLDDLISWTQDPTGYIFDSEKEEYRQNPYNSQNNSPLFSTLDF